MHGLQEGPRNAWSGSNDPAAFWPEWLSESEDPKFNHVRVHAFSHPGELVNRRTGSHSLDEYGEALIKELGQKPIIRRDASASQTLSQSEV